jgi:Tol biopolymer transport system component/DNA-binding winged helix-turn-helix (wHTH) protein
MEDKSPVFKFEDIEVHEREFSLTKGGETIAIEPKAFRVLLILLRNPQKLVSKDELLNAVWGDTAVTENSLTRAIALLRRLLADDAREPRFIETVTGVGYRFICPVEMADETAGIRTNTGMGNSPGVPGEASRPATSPQDSSTVGRRHLFRQTWLWAGLGTAILLGAVWYFTQTQPAPLRVASYTQITYGGRRTGVFLTDGSRLYLLSDYPNVPSEVAVSGGEIVPLNMTVPGNGFELDDISPDGTELLVVSTPPGGREGLWTQSLPGGTTRRLADAQFGSFAPDGKTVLYLSLKGDEIYSINIDGTGARRIASTGGEIQDPRWTPDAKHIRFERDSKLWEMAADGKDVHVLFPGFDQSGEQSYGRWSPDGRYYFFLVGGLGGQIWGMDEGKRYPWQSRNRPFQLTSGPLHWGVPVPGRDGKTIFATGETVAGELSRFDEKTHRFEPFLKGMSAEFASFSRDGKSVAYAAFPEGGLWKANSDGSGRTQLVSPPIYAANPQWSPDGSKIVFFDVHDLDKTASYIVSAAGGESPRKLLPDSTGVDGDPTWSADGKKILFAVRDARGNGDIRVLDLATAQVTVLPGSEGLYSPRWSPDGQTIAAEARVGPFLRVLDVGTQKWRVMNTTDLVAFPCFSKDSHTIYFFRYGKDQAIFRIRIPDGAEEKVADLRDFHSASIVGVSMSLDPTDAPLLTRRTGTDDVYALKLSR